MELGNYKIKVTTEAESREVCNMMEQLGLSKRQFTGFAFPCVIALYGNEYSDFTISNLETRNRKELTIPQLRDLVVLHRNDVSDATHIGKYFNSDVYLKTGDDWFYFQKDSWVKSKNSLDWFDSNVELFNKIIIDKNLISGADALRALADGREVDLRSKGQNWVNAKNNKHLLGVFFDDSFCFEFRLKPRTITLNIEIPAPFEPKRGEMYWFIDSSNDEGYTCVTFDNDGDDKRYVRFGTWRTEEEIKQVVAALRGALKNG